MNVRLYEVHAQFQAKPGDPLDTIRYMVIGTSPDDAKERVRAYVSPKASLPLVGLKVYEHLHDDIFYLGSRED